MPQFAILPASSPEDIPLQGASYLVAPSRFASLLSGSPAPLRGAYLVGVPPRAAARRALSGRHAPLRGAPSW